MTSSPVASVMRPLRTAVIAQSVIGVVIGLVAVFWPGPSLLVVAALFGVAVIVSGVVRLTLALSARHLPTGARWLVAILGVLIVAAGELCLTNPAATLLFLAITVGLGWIFGGGILLVVVSVMALFSLPRTAS